MAVFKTLFAATLALVCATPLAFAQGKSSMLRVACNGPSLGAEIRINGTFKGECPLDVEVQAGTLEVSALKRLDANREQRFTQTFGIGEGVVKRLDVQLGPPELNEAGRRAEAERRRLELERFRVETERRQAAEAEQRRLAEERRQREAAEAARRAELQRLAELQQQLRRNDRLRTLRDAFDAAGLRAGTGAPFRDCAECPEMVWIPAGQAPQAPGSSDRQRWFNGFELEVPLAVGRYEVTFAEWDACVAQGGCSRRPEEGVTEGMIFDSKWGRGRQPVINVSHADAQQFVAWLSQKTGQRYRLLSLIEFNYASRAGAATVYPWGDKPDAGAANCANCGGKSTDRTLAVGSFAPNAWGLFDMIGNVDEHVADCYGSHREGTQRGQVFAQWIKLAERKSVAEPIDQCSAAPGRNAVSDPATGVAGGRYGVALPGPGLVLFHQFIPRVDISSSSGLRVAREFTLPAPVFDRVALAPFRDCADCPELVKLPAGRFEMGSPYQSPEGSFDDEFPLRWVEVGEFAIGRFELTRGQFAAFARETGHKPAAGCNVVVARDKTTAVTLDLARGWADPGFAQGDDHPVTCLNRADAMAYLAWLSRKTGERYRLPSEAEWEYAARAHSAGRRPWGQEANSACWFTNLADARFHLAFGSSEAVCDDGHAHTAPVGQFRANAYGLHDMLGNVAEMVEDCHRPNYNGAPGNAEPVRQADCAAHGLRGGHWRAAATSKVLGLPGRTSMAPRAPTSYAGLRVVRETLPRPPGMATPVPVPSSPASPAPPAPPAPVPAAAPVPAPAPPSSPTPPAIPPSPPPSPPPGLVLPPLLPALPASAPGAR